MRIDKFEGKKEISGPVSRNSARYRLTPVREFKIDRSVANCRPVEPVTKNVLPFFTALKRR